MAHRMLKNAGIAPPWIESDKEARRLLAMLWAMLERAPRASMLARDRVRREEANQANLKKDGAVEEKAPETKPAEEKPATPAPEKPDAGKPAGK